MNENNDFVYCGGMLVCICETFSPLRSNGKLDLNSALFETAIGLIELRLEIYVTERLFDG